MTARAAQDRLAAEDFYLRLDRLRSEWHSDPSLWTEPDSSEARYADTRRQDALDVHERRIAANLRNIRWLLEQLPPRFYDAATKQYEELKRGRLSKDADWLGAIVRLREIISQWDRSRPPVIRCDYCGLDVRGQQQLRTHLLLIHNLEESS